MTVQTENLPGMVGRHPKMLQVYRRVRRVAPTDLPVLVSGETGTGKELVAGALHTLSKRAGGPFVAVNCAAIPETLAEAELFGCERGAYTGATQRRKGFLSQADGGTLFLDEVCSMPPAVQAKLLRAIELGEFSRVGGDAEVRSRFRLISAAAPAADGTTRADVLRHDLLHRIGTFRVVLPPLRERGADLVQLAESFLSPFHKRLAPDAGNVLASCRWTGNVRELRSLMECVAVLIDGPVVGPETLTYELEVRNAPSLQPYSLRSTLEEHAWNVSAAARALGIGRTRMYELLTEHGLRRPEALSA